MDVPFSSGHATGTGHHSVLLVDRDETVFRGQVIALTGHSGTNESHIHLNLHHYESNGTVPPTMDPFAYPNGENAFEKNNYWIEYNNLVCSY
jgi:murein DD-endopeptidase MepM/ murein hydrolase activator NlpD